MYLGQNYIRKEYSKVSYPVFNERRFTHTYVIGKTGMGKSTLLENLAIRDILKGEGIAFFDPHGDSIDKIMQHIPPEKVVLFDPTDEDFPIGFNPLHNPQDITFTVSALLDTFKAMWDLRDDVATYINLYLLYGFSALAEAPEATLFGFKYFLTSQKYRTSVLTHVKDKFVKDWWEIEFEERMPNKEQRTTVLSTLNRMATLFIDPKLRYILGQAKSTLDLKEIMDKGKCLLINLPQGKLGISRSAVLGALIMSQLHLTALRREKGNRRSFHIYADEAHHFGTMTLEEMLSGIRKFNVSLVLAHQYLDQLTPSLKSAIFGTVGTMVSFRVGPEDADILATEMGVLSNDLTELEPFTAWVRSDGSTKIDTPDIFFPAFEESPRQIRAITRNDYGRRMLPVKWKIEKFIRNST